MKASSLANVLPNSRWIGASLARAQISLINSVNDETVARELYNSTALSLKRSRQLVEQLRNKDFTELLDLRDKTGSAENPITKMFPAAVTERQFVDELERLQDSRPSIDYRDERFTGYTLVDFTIIDEDSELPVNVKNAGTRFENAAQLVGLDPNDCIPIPAYKAHDAIERQPSLLYAVSIDYTLIQKIESHLLTQFNADEAEVWRLLGKYKGTHIRDAEDKFVYSMVNKYWVDFIQEVALPVFRVISARKSIRILQTMPKRTPGIGLRAWGTGASAEVNVHVSIGSETKPWPEIHSRIESNGIDDIIQAVNRKRTEVVFDPEI
jgi:hypothetical protein